MPEAIVIGLSSNQREHHLHPGKGADKYLKFIKTEVLPYIDETYRTKSFNSISGHSLGGGFALYAFLKEPAIFNLCMAGSPYPIQQILKIQVDTFPDHRHLYSSMGTVDDISQKDFSALKKHLEANSQITTQFDIHQGESHISNIAINFQEGLKFFYTDWHFQLPETITQPIDKLLFQHYEQLSNKMGYAVNVNEWQVIYPIMDQLARNRDFDNAIKALKYCIKIHPKSDQAYAFLARAYVSTGDMIAAKENLRKALSLNPNNKMALQMKKRFSR